MRRTAAIDTARLRLRPYRESDLDALHRLWTDAECAAISGTTR
jgi:RimJ/RimL family protein N-acetyltransferase